MKVVEHVIKLKDKTEPLTIIPIGDIHIGSNGLDRKYLHEIVNWVKDKPNTYWIGMGDYAECIIHTDPRFDAKSVEKRYREQIGRIVDAQFDELEALFEPIKDKCLGLLEGNHERQMRKRHTFDMTRNLAHRLDVNYLETSAFLRIKFDRSQFHTRALTIFAHHGWFGGRKSGSKVNAMEDNMAHFDADIYLYAHAHDIITKMKPRVSIGSTGKKIIERKVLMCLCGSFVRAYTPEGSNYAEEKGLPPQKIGTVRIDLYPKNDGIDIHVRE